MTDSSRNISMLSSSQHPFLPGDFFVARGEVFDAQIALFLWSVDVTTTCLCEVFVSDESTLLFFFLFPLYLSISMYDVALLCVTTAHFFSLDGVWGTSGDAIPLRKRLQR